jgi:hypothetical protein
MLPRKIDPDICAISTFEENSFINIDGHITPIIVTNLPENRMIEGKILETNGSFASVKIYGKTTIIEFALTS